MWHCSLSLRAEEGALTDQQWGDIANDFVDSMGFTETSGKARCRWAAVNHGTSENGNHHIHLAVSLVREDGTKASTHGDYKRAQETCRELEVKYGLEQLSTVHATRGYDRAEKATAVRDNREMHRTSLARKVRASASASATEGEFVRRARDTGLLVRPRYAKDTTDVIVGYSVAERPGVGERPIWFGGGTLASDLKLGASGKNGPTPRTWPRKPQPNGTQRPEQAHRVQDRARERHAAGRSVGGIHPQRSRTGRPATHHSAGRSRDLGEGGTGSIGCVRGMVLPA
ncbi:hypothetical protein AHiyo1_43930 [Arthrobacter sp. Hiyo1]|uniref:relaxase/mobilization nuclease domain-containing protein n=1 Tax=Arthrobacter sp. Hiyo1 TaxID=1588020 RepID=UPI0006A35845|nr:relaxase/mobilization nuclease domain-containing protein [Arthrobacter sp. Hiyo1]GAP60802.1 hypothetical protein AHiyo1_43930 [Arthrobacter sp. Hiyo1]